MIKKILITGATGLIGSRLTELLIQKGHQVSYIGRSRRKGTTPSFTWNISDGYIESGALDGVNTIIHLAGAGVADKRWTKKRKQEILESRTKSTALLFDVLKKTQHSVTSFISASAIGYYGFAESGEVLTETSRPGDDFLARVTQQWEAEAEKIRQLNLRVVKLRIGIVLSDKGGALKEMSTPIKFYAGTPLGSGNQHMSWIYLDDLCNMFIAAVENENLNGVYNAVAPHPVTNRELTKAIARQLHKPLFLPPIPGFVLKLLLGERADMVIYGSKISSEKIERTGFTFNFRNLEEALKVLF